MQAFTAFEELYMSPQITLQCMRQTFYELRKDYSLLNNLYSPFKMVVQTASIKINKLKIKSSLLPHFQHLHLNRTLLAFIQCICSARVPKSKPQIKYHH